MKINKTNNGYQVVTSTGTPASADNLTDQEAKLLVRKIEAYKASRRLHKAVQPQLPKNGKRLRINNH
jgi:hypothetical protein